MSYRLRNIHSCNAIIHVITSYPVYHTSNTIFDILRNNSKFSVLTMALNMTGMSEYLHTRSPLTLFAPTNDAWAELDNATLTKIFEDNDKLRYIIKYHIIPSTIHSCLGVARRMTPYSLAGSRVRIGFNKYNYATVIESDITARNGVLQIIDKVVMYLYKRKYRV